MELPKQLVQQFSFIESKLGYHFKDLSLLVLAFIHPSYANENRDVPGHNERLEFLGDSILGLLIAEYLYKSLPELPEGELSNLRSRLVEASSCVAYIQKIDVGQYLLLGKGERKGEGRGRESMLADLFEAIVGAVYLDGGIEAARDFLLENFLQEMKATIFAPEKNWKALLQDHCQKRFHQLPLYRLISETGPDHFKIFKVAAMLAGKEIGIGEGSSKKQAQQQAAEDALIKLDREE